MEYLPDWRHGRPRGGAWVRAVWHDWSSLTLTNEERGRADQLSSRQKAAPRQIYVSEATGPTPSVLRRLGLPESY